MRFVNIYLIGYFILMIGGILALWQAGVLSQISPMWIAIGIVIAIGLGIMFAVASGKPTVTTERD